MHEPEPDQHRNVEGASDEELDEQVEAQPGESGEPGPFPPAVSRQGSNTSAPKHD